MKATAHDPKSKYLTHGKEYLVEWVSFDEKYFAVRNDKGRIRPYSKINFTWERQ